MREGPGGKASERHDAFKRLDFRPCFLLALRFQCLLVATYLSGSRCSVTHGAEARAEIFTYNPAPMDTSLQPEGLASCCRLLFIYSCNG